MIRKIRHDDFGQIVLIESLTQVAPWSEQIFKDCVQLNYPIWVMERDHKVVSFVIISLRSDECHLLNLCVHPQYQRQGIGLEMLGYVLNLAKKEGASMIYLEVRESNAKAIALYKKLGFVQINTRVDYYPAPEGRETALVLALDLGLGGG